MFKSVGRAWRKLAAVVGGIAGGLVLATGAVASATSYTLPEHFNIDKLGINIGTLLYERRDTLLSIGDPANGGLAWTFNSHLATDNYSGDISYWGQPAAGSHQFHVKLAGAVTLFVGCENGTCMNASGTGSTLVKTASNWVYTVEDGTIYTFSATGDYTTESQYTPIVSLGQLLSIQHPDGSLITISYYSGVNEIQSVVSNRGYALKYEWNGSGGDGLSKISAINLSNHVCDTTVTTCDGVDSYITFSYFDVTSAGNGNTYSVEQITDPAGNNWQYDIEYLPQASDFRNPIDWTSPDGLVYFKSPDGYEASLLYDAAGRLTSFTDNRGKWSYTYPGETLRTAENGSPYTPISVSDPSGNLYYTAHTTNQNIDWVKDAVGNQTTYTFYNGQVDFYVGSYVYGYGTYTRLTSIAEPEGNSKSWTYDSRGNIASITDTPKSGSGLSATTINASYDSTCSNPVKCNKPNWTQDARGNYTYYTYDPTHGGVTLVQSPADSSGVTPEKITAWAQYTAQIRNSAGAMTNAGTIWLPQTVSTCASAATCNGTSSQTVTTMSYNTYNLLPSSVTVAAGDNSLSATTSYTYDNVGNKTSVDGPRTDVSDISYTTYDADRRPVYEIGVDPDGAGALPHVVTHHIYAGTLETQTETGTSPNTDGSSFTRASYATASYNAMGQKTLTAAYIDGNGTAQTLTQFNYDVRGRANCTAVRMNPGVYGSIAGTDACSLGTTGSYGPDRITRNTYDNADHLTEIDQAYGVAGVQRAYARYTYNPNGTKATETDANNNTTGYVYDGFDRLSQIQYPSPSTAGSVNTADYEQFGYDNNGNKTSWRRRNGKTISYGYDALNRETTRSVSDGSVQTVYTGYDLEGHVLYARYGSTSGSGITNTYDALGELVSTQDMNNRLLQYQYNQASVQTRLTWPDGGYAGYTLDSLNRMTDLGGNASSGLIHWTFDNLGRPASLVRGASGVGGSTSYGYDNLGRLTSMTNDLAGTAFDVSWSFSYSPANQLATTSASSTVYDYKETANSTVGKAYDGLNRDATITAVVNGYDANGNLGNDGTRLFYYDVYNRLTGVGSSAYPNNGPYLTFAYDPLGRLSSQTYYGTTTSFLYDGTNLIGEYDGSGTVLRRYAFGPGTDQPLFWNEAANGGSNRYLYTDYHGSIIGYGDTSGNLIDLYKYGPFGEPKDINNGTNFSGARFRYTGQMVIPEASLYYYKARVYDPIMGHFLQTDPIGSKDDLDLYAYVGDDPVDHGDPTGTQCAIICPNGDAARQQTQEGAAIVQQVAKHPGESAQIAGAAASLIPTPETKIGGAIVSDAGTIIRATDHEDVGTAVPVTTKPTTLEPGPFANGSVPATSSGATPAERDQVTQIGQTSGCHTCGTTDPGTKSGNFVPDHQPPTKLNPENKPQELYPHCLSCSRTQGGEVRQSLLNQ